MAWGTLLPLFYELLFVCPFYYTEPDLFYLKMEVATIFEIGAKET